MGFELPKVKNLESGVFSITNEEDCFQIASEVFHYQFLTNPVYNAYCRALGCEPDKVISLQQVPFLPIQLFKSHSICSGDFQPEVIFRSSGTTGQITSSHYVKDLSIYERSFLTCFERFYGKTEELCIVGLLPSYLERENSSLVYMV